MRHNEYLLDKSYFEKVATLFNKGQSNPKKTPCRRARRD